MSRLSILVSVVALAAGSANCADAPGQANSVGDIGPSATMANASAPGATSTVAAAGGLKGKPGTTGGSSSLAVAMAIDADGDGVISAGDHVRFTISTSASNPFINLNCYQSSTWVYTAGGYPAGWEFTLAGNSWPGGAADCNAELYTTTDGTRTTTLATTAFEVAE